MKKFIRDAEMKWNISRLLSFEAFVKARRIDGVYFFVWNNWFYLESRKKNSEALINHDDTRSISFRDRLLWASVGLHSPGR